MKTLVKSAIVALALAGASLVAAPIPEANAQSSFGFYVGPDGGGRVYFNQGIYRDSYGERRYYRYPRDYRRYGNSRDYYRQNPNWYRDNNWRRRR